MRSIAIHTKNAEQPSIQQGNPSLGKRIRKVALAIAKFALPILIGVGVACLVGGPIGLGVGVAALIVSKLVIYAVDRKNIRAANLQKNVNEFEHSVETKQVRLTQERVKRAFEIALASHKKATGVHLSVQFNRYRFMLLNRIQDAAKQRRENARIQAAEDQRKLQAEENQRREDEIKNIPCGDTVELTL
ncbi:MAG: hypothetical protein WD595_01905 [Waddliaceae bacterium]